MTSVFVYHVLLLAASMAVVFLGYVLGQQMPTPHVLFYHTPWSDAATIAGHTVKFLSVRLLQYLMLVGWVVLLGLHAATGTMSGFTLVTSMTMIITHSSLAVWIHLALKNQAAAPQPVAQLSHRNSRANSIKVDEAVLVVVLQPDFEDQPGTVHPEDPEWLWTQHKGVSLGYAITQKHTPATECKCSPPSSPTHIAASTTNHHDCTSDTSHHSSASSSYCTEYCQHACDHAESYQASCSIGLQKGPVVTSTIRPRACPSNCSNEESASSSSQYFEVPSLHDSGASSSHCAETCSPNLERAQHVDVAFVPPQQQPSSSTIIIVGPARSAFMQSQ